MSCSLGTFHDGFEFKYQDFPLSQAVQLCFINVDTDHLVAEICEYRSLH